VSGVGAGSGELQLLEVAVPVLQSQVGKESHRGMPKVHEGLIPCISGCKTGQ